MKRFFNILGRKARKYYYTHRKKRRLVVAISFCVVYYYAKHKFNVDFDALFLLVGIWYLSEIKFR